MNVNLTPAGKKVLAAAAVAAASTALAFLLWAAGGLERWELRTWDWRAGAAGPAGPGHRQRPARPPRPAEPRLGAEGKRAVVAVAPGSLRRDHRVPAAGRGRKHRLRRPVHGALGVRRGRRRRARQRRRRAAGSSWGRCSSGRSPAPSPRGPTRIPRSSRTSGGSTGGCPRAGAASAPSPPRGCSPSRRSPPDAAVLADVQHNPDPDGIYRRARLFRVFDGKTVPSFALACLMAASPRLPVEISEGSMTVAGKRIPIDRDGNAILRFRGASGKAYRHYSAAAVIQSELKAQAGEEPVIKDPDAFRGRHVIFGFSAPGLYDLRPAPVGGVFPGSEIHATALDNLLSGDFMSEAGRAATLAAAFLLALLSAVSVVLSRKAWHSLLLFAVFLPLPVLLCLFAYSRGCWLPLVVQEAAVSLSLLGALAVNYATEGKQKRFIKGAFRQYLSPAVIDQLIEHPERLKLGGERRTLSIFFSDIQGFTGISEGLSPEALTALLNEYLSAMTDILHEEGGTVDKYIGDAIVAFWNAPLDQPDHAERAARSALRCQEKLAEMRPLIREKIGKDLFMRIGLNTGFAVVGNMGSRNRFDYTVLGDAVNLASRLEGINKQFGTYILASEALLRSLPGSFPSREISTVAVVGRKEPVRVFELLSRKDLEARGKEISSFAGGLEAFTAGNFPAALETFLSTAESDPAAASYARKCRALIERPPERWEGVWVMTEK